jgi:hypothetical protein
MESAVLSSTYGAGSEVGLSMEGWRVRIWQAWMARFIQRTMKLGKGHNLIGQMVYNTFQLTEKERLILMSLLRDSLCQKLLNVNNLTLL